MNCEENKKRTSQIMAKMKEHKVITISLCSVIILIITDIALINSFISILIDI